VPRLTLEPDEPAATGWRPVSLAHLAELLVPRADGPRVVAVDGRQGAGKTSLAARLAAQWRGTVVHTDDIAWWHGFFDWDDMAAQRVLEPWLAGEHIRFRPPAWVQRDREGCIEVPATSRVLVLEGVGSSRLSLAPWLTASVWVQADRPLARSRGLARDGGTCEVEAFWDEWEAAERDVLRADRPWERATAIVCGTPDALGIHVAAGDVLLAQR
jgi:hypothetical protein